MTDVQSPMSMDARVAIVESQVRTNTAHIGLVEQRVDAVEDRLDNWVAEIRGAMRIPKAVLTAAAVVPAVVAIGGVLHWW